VVLEGSPTYYGRLGFEPAASHGLTLPIPAWAPPGAAQVMRFRNDDPAISGTVSYPAAFGTGQEPSAHGSHSSPGQRASSET
jgi:putative acetyltransferase